MLFFLRQKKCGFGGLISCARSISVIRFTAHVISDNRDNTVTMVTTLHFGCNPRCPCLSDHTGLHLVRLLADAKLVQLAQFAVDG